MIQELFFGSCLLIGLVVMIGVLTCLPVQTRAAIRGEQVGARKVDTSLPIRIINPRKLGTWQLPAERITIGGGKGYYKPSLARMPDGELIMVALFYESLPGKGNREFTVLWRSRDGGRTWSSGTRVKDLIGREQFLSCTKDGILFATCHILPGDLNNPDGYAHSYISRSIDRGRTWQRTRIGPEGFPPKAMTTSDRTVVELPDGTLQLGVGTDGVPGRLGYIWTSSDKGKTWVQSKEPIKIDDWQYKGRPYHNLDGVFSNAFTFRTTSGKLLHWIRCGPPSTMYPMGDDRVVPKTHDQGDRTLICESDDGGRTWSNLRDFGDYGMMYVRILRLKDGRLLATYTQRGVIYPLGLRAMISEDEGQTWDFEYDQIIIEAKTTWGAMSGGGFGNTIQLDDGTLVSCYSYHKSEPSAGWPPPVIYTDVVRWRLPAGL